MAEHQPRVTPPPPPSLLLALSLCSDPVSIDRIVAWGVAAPSDIWRLLQPGLEGGPVAEVQPGSGRFAWVDERARLALWQEAALEDWQAALVHPDIIGAAVSLASAATVARDRGRAFVLYRALVNVADPARYPGGEIGFMWTVLETGRLFMHAEWRTVQTVDRALATARAAGEGEAEAALLGMRSNAAFYAGDLAGAIGYMERSRERSLDCGNSELARLTQVGLAVMQVLNGRYREGIASLEECLGDVPRDMLPTVDSLFGEDPTFSLEVLGTLALGYSVVGQPSRAVDLLRPALAEGERLGRGDVANLCKLWLGLISASYGNFGPPRQWYREVLEYRLGEGQRPFFAWFAAILAAAVHREDGRRDDARAALVAGHEARTRSGYPHFFGRDLFRVLEWLETSGIEAIDGLSLDGEISRTLASGNTRMQGIAHEFAARRLSAGGDRAESERHLVESERLLREAGALLDLAETLAARASFEDEAGRMATADELRRESADMRARIPPLAWGGVEAAGPVPARALRVLELGRLSTIGEQPGLWGEIAARACSVLGAERCAIVEMADPPRLLALRGGSQGWAQLVIDHLARQKAGEIQFLAPLGSEGGIGDGQLLLIPFRTARLGRSAVLALENRWTSPFARPADVPLVEALAAQLSVLLENTTLWRELQAARGRLEQENRYYREESRASEDSACVVGNSPALQRTLDLAARVAPTMTAVLITGETGVGKELIAREIHRLSARTKAPLITVHVASLAPGLVSSGLFGHERGAFTGATDMVRGRFELADRGTLFLDEIGELGPEEQVRLLRVLQDGVFERVGGTRPIRSDFRLIAATNRDLAAEVQSGRFREDLFYRLRVFPISVPPLRERLDDIPTLALYFMEQCGRRLGRPFEGIGEADMQRLKAYGWPGNVRELAHTIERAAVLSDGPRLVIPPLTPVERPGWPPVAEGEVAWVSLADAERRYLRQVLAHTAGRLTGTGGAAEILGLKPSTLAFRIAKLGLEGYVAGIRSAHRQRRKRLP